MRKSFLIYSVASDSLQKFLLFINKKVLKFVRTTCCTRLSLWRWASSPYFQASDKKLPSNWVKTLPLVSCKIPSKSAHALLAESFKRRKIRLIEGNANCRHPKKLTCKRTLRRRTPYPPPLTHCLTREKVRVATVHKAGSNTNMTDLYLQSINSDKHLPQSPSSGQFS